MLYRVKLCTRIRPVSLANNKLDRVTLRAALQLDRCSLDVGPTCSPSCVAIVMSLAAILIASLAVSDVVVVASGLAAVAELRRSTREQLATDARGSFDDEYPRALAQIEGFFASVRAQGRQHTVRTRPDGSEQLNEYLDFVFARSKGASKYEMTGQAPQDSTIVWCRNPDKYVFNLRRYSPNSEYAVVALNGKDSPTADSMERYSYRDLDASHSVYGVRVSKLMDDPSFQIKSVQYDADQGEVHVSYALSPDPPLVLRDGDLWLSPQLGWAITRFHSNYKYDSRPELVGQMNGTVEYSIMENGVAVPSRVVISTSYAGYKTNEDFQFQSVLRTQVPDEEFTLTSYALPEMDPLHYNPLAQEPRGFFSWGIPINVAAIVIIVAIMLWRRLRSYRFTSQGG
jgi:hypothetical protein